MATGVAELGGVAALAFTAASTMGLAGYAHCSVSDHCHCLPKAVFDRMPNVLNFKSKVRVYRKIHHLDPPHRKQFLAGPLRKEDVKVTVDKASFGKRAIEFNGEVLFIADEGGTLSPIIALGACEVQQIESRIVAVPPILPTVELIFEDQAEAIQWANEFKETVLVGPPHERIQELILHSIQVEKHINDLRGRAQRVHEIEQMNTKLKKDLGIKKAGLDSPEKKTPGGGLMGLIASSNFNADESAALDELNKLLQQHKEESAKAYAHAEAIKRQMDAHVSPEVHEGVHEQMQKHKEESEMAQQEAADLRRRVDELLFPREDGQSSPHSTPGPSYRTQSASMDDTADAQEQLKAVQTQLALSQKSFEEERRRTEGASVLIEALVAERQALQAQIELLDSQAEELRREEQMQQLMQPAVDQMTASFRGQLQSQQANFINQLEEQRMRHEMEVWQLKSMAEQKGSMAMTQSQGALSVESDLMLASSVSNLSIKVGDLAEENLTLKKQLAAKAEARRMEAAAEHIRFEEELDSLPRVQVTCIQPGYVQPDMENRALGSMADSGTVFQVSSPMSASLPNVPTVSPPPAAASPPRMSSKDVFLSSRVSVPSIASLSEVRRQASTALQSSPGATSWNPSARKASGGEVQSSRMPVPAPQPAPPTAARQSSKQSQTSQLANTPASVTRQASVANTPLGSTPTTTTTTTVANTPAAWSPPPDFRSIDNPARSAGLSKSVVQPLTPARTSSAPGSLPCASFQRRCSQEVQQSARAKEKRAGPTEGPIDGGPEQLRPVSARAPPSSASTAMKIRPLSTTADVEAFNARAAKYPIRA